MREIPDRSVHLVLTDPPYFTHGMNGAMPVSASKSSGCVQGLPPGMKFDPQQGRDLQSFMEPVAAEWMRLIKPGGFVLCFTQNRLSHRMACAIEAGGFEIRDMYAWRYEGQCKAFTHDHFIRRRPDAAAVLRRLGGRKTPQLKPQFETIVMAQAPREGTYVDNWLKHGVGMVDMAGGLLDDGCPGTVMAAPKPRERFGHMTAKPVDLMRHLIRIFTAPGATVLDPFAGSGTTGVAARTERRNFVGFELCPDMARTAAARMRGA